MIDLRLGDCLDVLRELPDNSVDAVITDPPYGLSFMGKEWDYGIPGQVYWEATLCVAKPGASLLAFGGTRTHHRLMCAIEDAGWEIRDCLMWLYGSGFPKSHDVSKAIDRAAGAERDVVGISPNSRFNNNKMYANGNGLRGHPTYQGDPITAPATDAAQEWQGWGTALKPAWEPIILAMKPLDGTFAQNAARHGVAGLNIDGARIATDDALVHGGPLRTNSGDTRNGKALGMFQNGTPNTYVQSPAGRWPANLLLDEDVVAEQKWTRYFYVAKASRSEREAGLDGMKTNGAQGARPGSPDPTGKFPDHDHRERGGNNHPTVKPLRLMEYLCTLTATPTGGVVLDPFMGSGTTGVAAVRTGRAFIGIEINEGYFNIAQKRISEAQMQETLVAL